MSELVSVKEERCRMNHDLLLFGELHNGIKGQKIYKHCHMEQKADPLSILLLCTSFILKKNTEDE